MFPFGYPVTSEKTWQTNSADDDQTARREAISSWSGSTLFAQAYLSKYFEWKQCFCEKKKKIVYLSADFAIYLSLPILPFIWCIAPSKAFFQLESTDIFLISAWKHLFWVSLEASLMSTRNIWAGTQQNLQ